MALGGSLQIRISDSKTELPQIDCCLSLPGPVPSKNKSDPCGRFSPRISHYLEKTIMKTLSENPIRAFQPVTSKLLANIATKCVCIGLLDAALLHAASPLEEANPIKPLPKPPLGISSSLSELKEPPSPERVRLGRWLFYDKRLSADGCVSCASCHQSEHAFSESTPHSTGIRGQKGGRKAPSFVNQAWTLYPHFFWDGRAGSFGGAGAWPDCQPD